MCWKSNQTEIKQTSNMIALVVLNLTIVLLSLATSGLCYSSDRYAGFSLYRSLPQTEAQLEKLHTLMVEKVRWIELLYSLLAIRNLDLTR